MATLQKVSLRFGVLVAMITITAFSRIIPHTPNFSPLGAIGLFGAAYFSRKWQALLIPIAATWLSDLFINNVIYSKYYPNFTWFYQGAYWQYGSYLIIVIAGTYILNKVNIQRVFTAALGSSAIFFFITNFGCWIGSTFYPQNISGLMPSYAAGIPFLLATMSGDLLYSGVLFGVFALVQNKFPALRIAHS